MGTRATAKHYINGGQVARVEQGMYKTRDSALADFVEGFYQLLCNTSSLFRSVRACFLLNFAFLISMHAACMQLNIMHATNAVETLSQIYVPWFSRASTACQKPGTSAHQQGDAMERLPIPL